MKTQLSLLSSEDPLQGARDVAKALGKEQRYVTADDVRERLEDWGLSAELGNAWGSLFRGRAWQPTSRRVKSRYAPNHSREIKVWEYVEATCTAA